MDSLYLLQFGCFLFMLINAAYLVLGSLHTQWQNKRYEHSRNLIVVALAILAFQYYLQMSLGLRATDDVYGALLNVLVYPLSFSLISIAIYHIEATHSRRRKMNLVCIGFYVAICLVCGIGYLQRGSAHLGAWLYVVQALFLASVVYGVVMIMIEMQKRRKRLESMAATDLLPYVRYSKASLFILFTAALVMPIAIISTQLLLIVGPLVLIALFFFIVTFMALGNNYVPSDELLDKDEEQEGELSPEEKPVMATLSDETKQQIKKKLEAWCAEKGYKEFMREKPVTVSLSEIDQPDVPLWAIWSIQQYAKVVGDEKCLKKYGKFIFDILHFLLEGKHPYMRVEDNGLVYVDGKGKVMTWMNSTVNGRLVVPRNGYIVEINSLWYNALGFAARLNKIEGDAQFTETLEELSARCKESFVKTFLNDYGYLFDYVDGNMMDWSVRPNMLFAIALDYSPLTADQRKSILDVCTRELLTPKGMRTLSPKSGGYNPICAGPQMQRDLSYHQGTAWPWLGGFYMEACLKIYRRTRLSFIERQLVGYEDEMQTNCLGTLPEMFDGNPPFKARGAISFAMNVGETLRTLSILEKYTDII